MTTGAECADCGDPTEEEDSVECDGTGCLDVIHIECALRCEWCAAQLCDDCAIPSRTIHDEDVYACDECACKGCDVQPGEECKCK